MKLRNQGLGFPPRKQHRQEQITLFETRRPLQNDYFYCLRHLKTFRAVEAPFDQQSSKRTRFQKDNGGRYPGGSTHDVSAGYSRLGPGLVLELLSLDDLGFTLGGLSEAKSSARDERTS
jgi:hypothetical protein